MSASVLPYTSSVAEYLTNKLTPVEQSTFELWRQLTGLVKICEKVLSGEIEKFSADSAIRQFNQENDTAFTFEEIIGRSVDRFELADVGEWVAYVHHNDQESVLFGRYDEIGTALACSSRCVSWGVVLYPSSEMVVVYRSPFIERRLPYLIEDEPLVLEDLDMVICDGLHEGQIPAYTLPAEELGSIRSELNGR